MLLSFVQIRMHPNVQNIISHSPVSIKKTKTVSLLVTPDEAMLVKLAEEVGRLHLAMRSKTDATRRVAEDEKFDPTAMTDFFTPGGGEDEEEEEEGEEELEEEKETDLESFLDANSEPLPLEEVEFQPISVPEIPTWEIEILAGDERRVEEVPLPADEIELKTEEENGNPVLDGLKRLFGGGSKQKKTDSQVPQVEPAGTN